MKKVLNINLGGYPFTINDDAYSLLYDYTDQLERVFGKSRGKDEIMHDIEARMAELLIKRMDGRKIVDSEDITYLMRVMGHPSEMSDVGDNYEEPFSDTGDTTGSESTNQYEIKTGKRLFRDTENKVVGGVCSGLSAYFGISDPVWLRLAAVIGFFLYGSTMLIYIILWAVVPKAKTAADRLEMKGERANVNNIARTIEKELAVLRDELKSIGKEFNGKKSRKHKDK